MRLFRHRRDLRAADNRGSAAAATHDGGGTVVPAFVVDDDPLAYASPPRVRFMLDALAALRARYRERGSDLVVVRGGPSAEVPTDRIHGWTGLTDEERREASEAYPHPIVDHAEAREDAIAMFERARGEDPEEYRAGEPGENSYRRTPHRPGGTMKKVLASVGIGNASVDTVLDSTTVRSGETVGARIEVEGGDAEQEVGAVRLELETRYLTEEEGYRDADVRTYTLSEGFTVEPGAERTLETEVEIPYETPLTLGSTDVWVETELDISMAVDPEDRDALEVRPTPRTEAAFDAMESLGFTLRSVEVAADPYGRYFGGSRFVQEFEYRTSGGPFAGDVDEVELVPRDGPDELDLFVEVDRRGGVFSEVTDTDESHTRLTLASTDSAEVERELREAIERHA